MSKMDGEVDNPDQQGEGFDWLKPMGSVAQARVKAAEVSLDEVNKTTLSEVGIRAALYKWYTRTFHSDKQSDGEVATKDMTNGRN